MSYNDLQVYENCGERPPGGYGYRRGTVMIPKFKIILDALRESVISGEYREGARLPSEAELVRRFGVARMTIVKAFKELEQLGTCRSSARFGHICSSYRPGQQVVRIVDSGTGANGDL